MERKRSTRCHHLAMVSVAYASPSTYCGDDDVYIACVKNGQFALFCKGTQPIGYISWAYFDEVAQAHYLESDRHLRDNSDWNCGDNIWLIQWFAPLGHSHQMRSAVRQLFPSTTVRALYHKGSDKGLRILTFKT